MELPDFLLTHDIEIAPYRGDTGAGPSYGPEFAERAFVDAVSRTVRTADATKLTASHAVYTHLDVDCPVGSRITVAGQVLVAIEVKVRDGGDIGVPNHLEITAG